MKKIVFVIVLFLFFLSAFEISFDSFDFKFAAQTSTLMAQSSSAQSGSGASAAEASAKKEEKAATKSVKKGEGFFKKIFKKIGSLFKGKPTAGVSNHKDKQSYKKRSMHDDDNKKYKDSDPKAQAKWNTLTQVARNTKFKGQYKPLDDSIVLGWHPHWMGSAYNNYNFSLLTTFAYYAMTFNPKTGKTTNTYNWKSDRAISAAQKQGLDVLLTVTNFGEDNNQTFLKKLDAQNTLIQNLLTLVKDRKANGVLIDFEGVTSRYADEFSHFIANLALTFQKENKDYIVAIVVPALDFEQGYSVKTMSSYVNFIVVLGFDFYGAGSETAGPTALLESGKIWWEYSIQGSINDYLAQGIQANQIVLALPYYGISWETEDLNIPSKAKTYNGFLTYSQIRKSYSEESQFETQSQSSYYVVPDEKNKKATQIWFDNEKSLKAKYAWVKKQKLGGVAIWALGFDDGYTELWQVLSEEFFKISLTETLKEDAENISLVGFVQKVLGEKAKGDLINDPKALLILTLVGVVLGVIVMTLFSITIFRKKDIP